MNYSVNRIATLRGGIKGGVDLARKKIKQPTYILHYTILQYIYSIAIFFIKGNILRNLWKLEIADGEGYCLYYG